MKRWDLRPVEIRNLFNPAFCGLVLFRALAAYEDEDARGMPFSLTLLILPLCLQRDARETLSKANRSYFLKIVAANPQMLVDLPKRTTDLLPFAFEALGVLMQLGVLIVTPDGRLQTVRKGVRKSIDGTSESIACQRVAKFLGREFAQISDRVTIYTTLGVRP
ncbi:hypothetical protein C8J34_11644 [Rhizobium sp. PP-F2F-G36]|nr:hypothetical protein C8J34_11644 [Rhizobium sp. PP-F2F-G36]